MVLTININKKIITNFFFTTLVLVLPLIFLSIFFTATTPAYAATSPTLIDSSSYSVLSGSTVTNTGATTIGGNVGISPAGGGGYAESGSTTYGTGSSLHNADTSAANAQADNLTAFGSLIAAPNATCNFDYGAVTKELNGLTLVPGVYCADAFHLSGTLTLDDTGAPDGVWIFRSDLSTLVTSSGVGAKVQFLTGVGLPCNVWWRVASSATIGVGTTFIGNILASTAIQLETNATLNGRAFAYTAAVTLDTNTISGPSCTAVTPTPTSTPSSNSTSSSGGAASAPAAKICPNLNCVTPLIIESRRVDADSIFISWGPYAGVSTFIVQYGLENGKWLYNTKVTGFSTTINSLPPNQPIWVLVAPTDDCTIGPCGVAKLVGGPKLPNTGIAPAQNNIPWYIPASIFVGIPILLVLIQRKHKFLSKHEGLQ